jgi:hypothetical protein
VRRLAALLGAVLLLAGCRVDGHVVIRLDENGSGAVALRLTFDAEAVQALEFGGASIEERVLLDDLGAAGWKVGAWERAPGQVAYLGGAVTGGDPLSWQVFAKGSWVFSM